MNSKNNCIICGAEIIYSTAGKEHECYFCHKKFVSEAQCTNGHFVCDQCHSKPAMTLIMDFCLKEKSKNPIHIATEIMKHPSIHMHGPEHHVLVPSALLTAYYNAGGKIDLPKALKTAKDRGEKVPGGICGFWGSCGAAIGTGIFYSIITDDSPMEKEIWGQGNLMTAKSLTAISRTGGPRCCKRDSWTAILTAIDYAKEKTGIQMEKPKNISCRFTALNKECIAKRCPFYPESNQEKTGEHI